MKNYCHDMEWLREMTNDECEAFAKLRDYDYLGLNPEYFNSAGTRIPHESCFGCNLNTKHKTVLFSDKKNPSCKVRSIFFF